MLTKRFRHTINFVAALNVEVIDDTGRRVNLLVFPMTLFFVTIPAALYAWLRRALAAAAGFGRRVWLVLFGPGWAADLALMRRAVVELVVGPGSGEVGR